ncbi:MAG: hypothetical protein ACU843_12995 [Gammaproteobacteria bacterium]
MRGTRGFDYHALNQGECRIVSLAGSAFFQSLPSGTDMWDFNLLNATQTLEKTMAYMIYRLAMYLVLSFVLVFGIVAGTGSGLILDSMFSTSNLLARVGGVAGLLLFSAILYWFRGTWLFTMRAPHIALLNESREEAFVQQGWSQIVHARSRVSSRFSTSTELHTLDGRVKNVLAFLFRQKTGFGKWLSGFEGRPFFGTVVRLLEAPASAGHEVILAECLKDVSRPASSVAITTLTLFAQNYDRLFRNALVLLILKYLLAFVIFLVMLSPIGWLDTIIPVEFGKWSYVFALLLTWPIKSALFDPIATAALTGVFPNLVRGQNPDPETEAKLAADSPEFAALKRQAEFLERNT